MFDLSQETTDLLSNLASIFVIGATVLGSARWITSKIINGLKLEFQSNIGQLKSDIKNIKDDIDEIKTDLRELRNDVTDIDRRLCKLEGAFMNKECCMIQDQRRMDKAE